jgi:hypothetical protein
MQKLLTSMIRISIFACLAILAGTILLLPKTANKRVYARAICNGSCGAGTVCSSGPEGASCMCEPIGSSFVCRSPSQPVPILPGAQAKK